MSEKQVDVLAVMRRVSRHIPHEDFIDYDDAIAAVAELIAAASAAMRKYGCGTALECDVCVPLRDALDRVRSS